MEKNFKILSSSYGSVGRVVASNTRDPRFGSSRWQTLFTINRIEKTTRNRGLVWTILKQIENFLNAEDIPGFELLNRKSNLKDWPRCI